MAESQESSTFRTRTVAVSRRHSTDGSLTSGTESDPGPGPGDSERFHPYRRQFSHGATSAAGCSQQCSPPTTTDILSHVGDVSPSWEQYNNNIQSSYPELLAVEPDCFQTPGYPSYPSHSHLQGFLQTDDQSGCSKSFLQNLSMASHQESGSQSLFPKPIYSYSILIFMALKNSKTGSLPVSEIYSFMTEHFPYFKTAPDGWKNSVRHNLSLNKCFEKVENRNGNSSRKGCLWALNPTKVEKMQEELHKWRRKDPINMRRSMARPEDFDRLLGQKPERLRSMQAHTGSPLLFRGTPSHRSLSSSSFPAHLRPPAYPPAHYKHLPPHHHGFPPTDPAAPPELSFPLCSPCGQQYAATVGLNSPVVSTMAPVHSPALQEYGVGYRSVQDLLLEGEATCDIDALNPSLTDLQLQGKVWDDLREDSLSQISEAHTDTSPLHDFHTRSSCFQSTAPTSHMSPVPATGPYRVDSGDEDTGVGQAVEQHGCLSGLHPLAGYLTSCATSISLI